MLVRPASSPHRQINKFFDSRASNLDSTFPMSVRLFEDPSTKLYNINVINVARLRNDEPEKKTASSGSRCYRSFRMIKSFYSERVQSRGSKRFVVASPLPSLWSLVLSLQNLACTTALIVSSFLACLLARSELNPCGISSRRRWR